MNVLSLTGIPSPESFLGVNSGDSISLFFETADPSEKLSIMSVGQLEVKCETLVNGDNGVSLNGEVLSPPAFAGRLALVDILWDTQSGYSGQAVISDIVR